MEEELENLINDIVSVSVMADKINKDRVLLCCDLLAHVIQERTRHNVRQEFQMNDRQSEG